MLARIQSEAQLATLLGHELTHATHRHTIQALRGIRRTSAALATFQCSRFAIRRVRCSRYSARSGRVYGAVTGYSRGKNEKPTKSVSA